MPELCCARDDRTGSPMTLHDCMEYAISHSTKMRIANAAKDDARIARRDAALALFTPQINANTYAYYNFGRSIDPQTNTYIKTTSFHNSYSVSAGYDLFDGFQTVNNYRIAKTGILIAASEQKQAEADICLAVMEAYYNVVYYKRLTQVYEQQVETAEKTHEQARRQEEMGRKSHADVIQTEADLAERRYELTNMQNEYRAQYLTLTDLMFWQQENELLLDTSVFRRSNHSVFAERIDTSVPSALSNHSVFAERIYARTLSTPTATDRQQPAITYALEHNPAVQIAKWRQVNARRELQTAKWQTLPTLGLYAGWNTSYYQYKGTTTMSFADQFRNNGGEYVQLSLSLPLWDRLARGSRISRKKHALEKANAELDAKQREVETEVRRAIQDRDANIEAYLAARQKVRLRTEAYRLNRKQWEQGLISHIEFRTAENDYLRALSDEMKSLFQLLIKQAVVEYYSGIEYINQQ